MKFCPKCGSLLELVHRSRAILKCRKCEFTDKPQQDDLLEKKKNQSHEQNLPEVAVLGKKETKLRTFPVVKSKCEKCGKNESESWTIEVGSQGTSSITFFRCTSCGHTRRETE